MPGSLRKPGVSREQVSGFVLQLCTINAHQRPICEALQYIRE